MLQQIEKFIHRIGCLILMDRAVDPSANGHIQLNGADIKAYSGGAVRSLTDLAGFGAPSLTLGTTNVEGSDTGLRRDASIALFDATNPSTQAHGDAAAVGSAAVASRRDHKHGMPAAGGPTQALQAALEAETDENTYAPPDLLHFGPWAVKAHANIAANGTLQAGSYNTTSAAKNSSGNYTWTIATDFSSADWQALAVAVSGADRTATTTTYAAGSCGILTWSANDGVATDAQLNAIGLGDQR